MREVALSEVCNARVKSTRIALTERHFRVNRVRRRDTVRDGPRRKGEDGKEKHVAQIL